MIENPSFIEEQSRKLSHAFSQMKRAEQYGFDKQSIRYSINEYDSVLMNQQFFAGMEKVVTSIREDFYTVKEYDLFNKLLMKEKEIK